jgi:hypothetical protein
MKISGALACNAPARSTTTASSGLITVDAALILQRFVPRDLIVRIVLFKDLLVQASYVFIPLVLYQYHLHLEFPGLARRAYDPWLL